MMGRIVGPVILDAAQVTDENMDPNNPIGPTKYQPTYSKGTNFATAIGGTPATRTEIVHVANQDGTIRGFHCLLNDYGSSTDIDFDLQVNGVSVLSAAVNVTHALTDGEVQDGVIATPAISADDIVSIVMTVTSSTGAKGAYAWVNLSENSAPS